MCSFTTWCAPPTDGNFEIAVPTYKIDAPLFRFLDDEKALTSKLKCKMSLFLALQCENKRTVTNKTLSYFTSKIF